MDQWYKYVRENKGDKKDTCQSALVLANIFQYLFMHQKENPKKPPTKVKRTTEEMQTLENKKKVIANSPRSVLKKKKKVEKEELHVYE